MGLREHPDPQGQLPTGDPRAVGEDRPWTPVFHTAWLDTSRWHCHRSVSYKDIIALAWSLRGGGRWHLVRGRLWLPGQGPSHTPALQQHLSEHDTLCLKCTENTMKHVRQRT